LTGLVPIFVDMANPQASTRPSSRPRNRPTTTSVPIPQSRAETHELRELLETYLLAMQALLEEHQRTVDRSLRAIDGTRAEMRTHLLPELRALGDHRAPWVKAITETRALLYVALRELVVGDAEAGATIRLPARPAHGGPSLS
jgi:hypothetical protein